MVLLSINRKTIQSKDLKQCKVILIVLLYSGVVTIFYYITDPLLVMDKEQPPTPPPQSNNNNKQTKNKTTTTTTSLFQQHKELNSFILYLPKLILLVQCPPEIGPKDCHEKLNYK